MLDGISPNEVGNRWVVGIDREAKILGITTERYYHLWREAIDKSGLSPHLKTDVLSRLDLCIHKGVHILILTIPPQQSVSLLDGKIYTRDGDRTVEATPEKIVAISDRFRS
jgi:predicted HTH transcriptional regulator